MFSIMHWIVQGRSLGTGGLNLCRGGPYWFCYAMLTGNVECTTHSDQEVYSVQPTMMVRSISTCG